jgi:hypothetical protein
MIRGISSKSLNRMTAKLAQNWYRSLSHAVQKAWLAHRYEYQRANTASHRFHFSNFRYYLTLFSKFFASFPHGTCSLSVSHQYLALDGIYHPLSAAIPNNTTRRKPVVHPLWQAWTGLSPSKAVRSRTLCPPRRADLTSPDYNSEDFQSELFPLHSPLLRESWLVSFPPPSYMLKFSGYSCLIGGPKRVKLSLVSSPRDSRQLGVEKTRFNFHQ